MATATGGGRITLEVRQAIRDAYEPLRDMTEEDLIAAVALLPDDVRARLAEGPARGRFNCGVCDAFPAFNDIPDDPETPEWRVFSYHEIPKLDMFYNDQHWYGELANEQFRRCIATYRAAGWTGEAQDPNA